MSATSIYPYVGIIGGMGPQATVLLQQRLIEAIDAEDDCHHIPLLVNMNPQIPSRLDYLLHDTGDNPAPVLQTMAKQLASMGAKAIAMPCNTAHYFASHISDAINVPFLNMVNLTVKALTSQLPAGGKVGILASPATEKIKLFHQACAPFDIEVVYPQDSTIMLSMIQRIKKKGVSKEDAIQLGIAAKSCQDRGAQALLVGCTEFSLIEKQALDSLPVVDALDQLVDAIVDFAKDGSLRT